MKHVLSNVSKGSSGLWRRAKKLHYCRKSQVRWRIVSLSLSLFLSFSLYLSLSPSSSSSLVSFSINVSTVILFSYLHSLFHQKELSWNRSKPSEQMACWIVLSQSCSWWSKSTKCPFFRGKVKDTTAKPIPNKRDIKKENKKNFPYYRDKSSMYINSMDLRNMPIPRFCFFFLFFLILSVYQFGLLIEIWFRHCFMFVLSLFVIVDLRQTNMHNKDTMTWFFANTKRAKFYFLLILFFLLIWYFIQLIASLSSKVSPVK